MLALLTLPEIKDRSFGKPQKIKAKTTLLQMLSETRAGQLWRHHLEALDFSYFTLKTYLGEITLFISQAIASWFAVWRVGNPPSSLWSGQASMMCSIDCSSPHFHSGLWRLAKHGPCRVLKWSSVTHCPLGRLVPGTCWLGFVTMSLFGAPLESHSSCQAVRMLKSAGEGFSRMAVWMGVKQWVVCRCLRGIGRWGEALAFWSILWVSAACRMWGGLELGVDMVCLTWPGPGRSTIFCCRVWKDQCYAEWRLLPLNMVGASTFF